MRILTQIVWLVLWLVLFLAMPRLVAQDMSGSLDVADSLLTQQKYDQAIGLYLDAIPQLYSASQIAGALSKLSECYIETRRYEKALETIGQLEKRYPEYTGAAQLKCRVYLEMGSETAYASALQAMLEKTPLPQRIWPLIERDYQLRRVVLPPGTPLPWARHAKYAELPAATTVRDRLLWWAHVYTTDQAAFLKEGLAATQSADTATTADALLMPLFVAMKLYHPLLKAGQRTDALAVNRRIQQAIERLKNPFGWKAVDLGIFTETMSHDDPQAYASWMGARIELLKTPLTAADMDAEMALYSAFYRSMIASGHPEQVVRLHEQLQKQLAPPVTSNYALAEQQQFLQQIGRVRLFYTYARDAGRFKEMKQAHDFVQQYYPKINRVDFVEIDNQEFARVTGRLPRLLYWRQLLLNLALGDTERARLWRDALVCTGNDAYARRAAELLPAGN